MFKALKDSAPQTDQMSRWLDNFQPSLERIASRPSRKSQAAECRKILLDSIEKRSVLWVLIGIKDVEVRDALISAFFEDSALQDVPNLAHFVTQQYVHYLLDGIALTILHRQQFDSTVKVESFDTAYDGMCKISAEIMVKKVMLSGISGSETPTGRVYRSEIVEPLEERLESTKRNYRDNLGLLLPREPDNSEFQGFLKTYSKKLETFEKASSVVSGAV